MGKRFRFFFSFRQVEGMLLMKCFTGTSPAPLPCFINSATVYVGYDHLHQVLTASSRKYLQVRIFFN